MLLRKMLRDLWISKGTYLACIVIMAIGLMTFNMFSIGYDNFGASRAIYYKEKSFADGFAQVEGMPLSALGKLERLNEIKQVDGRLVKDVRVITKADAPAKYLRVISFRKEDIPQLNRFELIAGTVPESRMNSLLLDSKFYEANALASGSRLKIAAEGKIIDLSVAGSARSPEYIYAMRTDQDLYPDPKEFGIAFMPYDAMRKTFMAGQSVNDVSFTINSGVDFKDAKASIEPYLKQYGLKSLIEQKYQKSHAIVKSEFDGIKGMATSMPLIFLGVAAIILIIMLKRLVEQQRGQIGVLKAFGYKDIEILIHYMSYALVVGLGGGILGGVLGNLLALPFIGMYQSFFNMPLQSAGFSVKYFLYGILMAEGFALIAGYLGAKASLKLEPAEAMRPPAPKSAKATIIERFKLLWDQLDMINRIAIRNIFRNKGRSLFVMAGVIFTFSILGMPWALNDNMNVMIYGQFDKVMVYDAKITLEKPVDKDAALKEILMREGFEYGEALLEIPGSLYNETHKKDVLVLGIENKSQLYNILNNSKEKIELPDDGIVISQRLAGLLKVKEGDVLRFESPYSRAVDQASYLTISAVVPQYLGLNAYMKEDALVKTLRQHPFTTSIIVKASEAGITSLIDEYRDSSVVFSIQSQADLIGKYQSLMQTMIAMLGIFVVIGILSGFSIIYATSMIAVSERQRELASMLVIGMRYKEVKRVMYLEQWYIAVAGFILGIPVLKLLIDSMALMMNNDIYSIPTDMTWQCIVSAVILTMVSILIAQINLGKNIQNIRLVESLSLRE